MRDEASRGRTRSHRRARGSAGGSLAQARATHARARACRPRQPFPPMLRANRPARIDEMLVCSPKGEVLYEWKCGNANDRVSFLEFLSQKSGQLGEGLNLGAFRSPRNGGRTLPGHRPGQIRSRPVCPHHQRRSPPMKEHVHSWLTEKMKIAGVLACGMRAPDRKTFTRSASPQFTPVALEHACRCLADTFQILGSNRFPSGLGPLGLHQLLCLWLHSRGWHLPRGARPGARRRICSQPTLRT